MFIAKSIEKLHMPCLSRCALCMSQNVLESGVHHLVSEGNVLTGFVIDTLYNLTNSYKAILTCMC